MFFGKNRTYLVLGASKSPFKFGHKVLKWYIRNKLNVVPINPRSEEILDIKAYKSINDFIETDKCSDISISVITPIEVTFESFNNLKKLDNKDIDRIKSIWFQPGSYNNKVIKLVKEELGIKNIISGGECILVTGKSIMEEDLS